MKKVARMRLSPHSVHEDMHSSNSEPIVRTTGRIKKPKAVFDPSDNYLPRSQQRSLTGVACSSLFHGSNSSSLERRASYTKTSTVSPITPSESKDACVICRKKISKRPAFAIKNPLITCQGCQRKIHKQCLKVDYEDFEGIQRNYKCEKCITCKICNDIFTNPEEEMITCSKCTKCFHLNCFPTKIVKTDNQSNWKCNKCQVYNQITNGTSLPVKKIREIIGSGDPPSLNNSDKSVSSTTDKTDEISNDKAIPCSASPAIENVIEKNLKDDAKTKETEVDESNPPPEKRSKDSNASPDTITAETLSLNTPSKSETTEVCYTPNENFDDIPDVKEWSVSQVYEYFYKYFPKEAHIFKNEEIDGRSLLLLKRSDIVKKLPIKLGPSLRIYSLILKIQAQINDPTLGWNCGL